jgi:hypothetical protein
MTEPVDALVESLAYTLAWLPDDKNFQLVLAHDLSTVSAGITSDVAIAFGHAVLQGLDVDWPGLGLGDDALDFIAEYMLRILPSFMIDPGRPPRVGVDLRHHLRRWIAPIVESQIAISRS